MLNVPKLLIIYAITEPANSNLAKMMEIVLGLPTPSAEQSDVMNFVLSVLHAAIAYRLAKGVTLVLGVVSEFFWGESFYVVHMTHQDYLFYSVIMNENSRNQISIHKLFGLNGFFLVKSPKNTT
jgi:hypothetical protein